VGADPTGVLVAIVSYNSEAVLGECLAALPAALAGVPATVVVVDNASTDGSRDLVRAVAPEAVLVELPANGGYAAGINAACGAYPGRDVLVLNPDVRMGAGSVPRLLAALDQPGTGIAVPRLHDAAGRLHRSLRREPTVLRALGEAVLGGRLAGRIAPLGEVVGAARHYARPTTADWATGAAMLVSAPCLEAVGGWDESFFLYSEETDFALRARGAGFALRLVPDAAAVHLGGEATTRPDLWAVLTTNRVRLYGRRHGPLATAAFRAAVTLNAALRAPLEATHRAALRRLLPNWCVNRAGNSAIRAPGRSEPPSYICFSAQDWWYHNRGHSDPQLMRRVARTRRVLYVNSIGLRMPRPGRSSDPLRRIARKAASTARYLRRPLPDTPNFHVMTPLVLPWYGSRRGRAANAALVRWQVTAVARLLGIRDPVVVVTVPTAWDVVRPMGRRALVVNRSDRYSAFREADTGAIAALERDLLCHCDRAVYVSRALMEEERPWHEGRAVFLDHGVDLEHFRPGGNGPEPPDLAAIPHPRVGFFGGLDDYVVDMDLLAGVAAHLPGAQLVLVGDANGSLGALPGLPNVHLLGRRPYERIPAYGAGFDVALMPWLDNEWVAACNPVKLKEYLALGLPVVSTPFPEVGRWEPWVAVAARPEEFVAEVRSALAHGPDPDGAARRRAAVTGHSWDGTAERFVAICEGRA
jgi:GT2 family glycosyltransferase/glycosyltransferase involved in cell wall biosynthesis